MSEKRTVQFSIKARATVMGEIELTQEEYDAWVSKIDSAKGFERERLAEELAFQSGVDWMDAEFSDDEVDEFDWKEQDAPPA